MFRMLLNEVLHNKSGRTLLYIVAVFAAIILLGLFLPAIVTYVVIAFALAAAIAYVELRM